MKITFIVVGKLKEKYFSDAVKEYVKRLTRYVSLNIIEIADEKAPENLSLAQRDIIRKTEGQRILKNLKANSFVIATELSGKALSSEELARQISNIALNGISHIYFIIGGSVGLSCEVLERADYLLSFSKMTFPHQLMRVILIEQIYRSFKIINNEPYHK